MHTVVCSWVIGGLIPYPDDDQCSFSKGKKNAHGLGCFSSLYFIYFITTRYLLETKHHIVPEDMWNYFVKKKRVTSFSSMNVGYQITTLKMLQTLGKTINFQDYQPLWCGHGCLMFPLKTSALMGQQEWGCESHFSPIPSRAVQQATSSAYWGYESSPWIF